MTATAADVVDNGSQQGRNNDSFNGSSANLWYFSIGSMMLPQSCKNRNFHPEESRPAELLDFKLNFFGPMGFAEAVPSTSDSLHGVIHRVTPEQMLELDNVEVGYIRNLGKARPYTRDNIQGKQTLVDVTVYCRPEEERAPDEDQPPQERYLEILIEGAKFHGVDPAYINFLQSHNVQKRTPPHQFVSFDDPPDVHYREVPEPQDGKLYFTVNGKVLELSYPPDNRHGKFMGYLRTKYGPHLELAMSQVAFDLKYGTVEHLQDLKAEHSAYIEDIHVRFMKRYDELGYCTVLGKFQYPNRAD